ncbi:MAG TPA: YbhB/YbcL family Raf kinase inhibitor-like protein [Bacteroidota bacterium]|nr:YbhB/YbcL family Raf kinase inhibitor-like protein [Bacteroidota bacterium]
MTLEVRSPAFSQGETIPRRYTCDGENISPALEWSAVPEETQSIAVIADDPDAPRKTWVHWVLFNLPAALERLEEDVPKTGTLENNAKQGINDANELGYDGPCPPNGTHRYYFKVYALDTIVSLKSGCTKEQLLAEIEGHALADGVLMGRYAR